jgi:hypothetical protein
MGGGSMSQTQTPEEYFLSTFTPVEEAALEDHTRLTCIACGKSFQITLDDPYKAICDDCLREGGDT